MNSHHEARESRIAANTLPTYHCNKTYHFEKYKKMVKQAQPKEKQTQPNEEPEDGRNFKSAYQNDEVLQLCSMLNGFALV